MTLMQLIRELHLGQPLAIPDARIARYQEANGVAMVRRKQLIIHVRRQQDVAEGVNGLLQRDGDPEVAASPSRLSRLYSRSLRSIALYEYIYVYT